MYLCSIDVLKAFTENFEYHVANMINNNILFRISSKIL